MQNKVYFKGLNGLRFFAASMVLIWHSNRIITPSGFNYNPIWHFISQNGSNAVSFFFVLSGFLISYLLIVEYEKSNTIVVKRFYLKRVLRIWPIYYFVVIFVQLILPVIFHMFGLKYLEISNLSTFFYLVILPNVPYIFELGVGKIGHLWSIGVEEQFYLIWPVIIKSVKKNILKICFVIVGLKLIFCFIFYAIDLGIENRAIKLTISLINNFAIEKMAIGGIGAYLVYYYRIKLMRSFIFSIPAQILLLALLFFYMCTNETIISTPVISSFYHILFGNSVISVLIIPVLFLYLIINTSLNEKSLIRTESKWLNYLGNISFGFYMYHMIALYVTEVLIVKFNFHQGSLLFGMVFLAIAFSINILISAISYRYFESIFIKMRPKE